MSNNKHVLNKKQFDREMRKIGTGATWKPTLCQKKRHSTDSDFDMLFAVSHFDGNESWSSIVVNFIDFFCYFAHRAASLPQRSSCQMLHSALNPTPETSNLHATTRAIFKKNDHIPSHANAFPSIGFPQLIQLATA